ncbi:MAG: MraY family glycosyltransferase [Acidimicrobiales bacterium]
MVLRRLGVLDVPNERSSHDRPTLRGGGIASAVGAVAGILLSTQLTGTSRVAVLVSSCGFGLVGLAEDLVGLPVPARLVFQAACAVAALPWLASHLSGPTLWRATFRAGVVLWLLAFANAFNFMDGIDGMSVAQAVVAGLAWCAAGQIDGVPALAAGGAVVAAAAAGFAPFNVPRPRLFLGDTGSYFLGASLAALVVVGLRTRVPSEALIAPLAVYLVDTGFTLVRRAARGEAWYLPHRDHVYQRLVRGGWSHVRTTLVIAGFMAVCSALGAVSLLRHPVALRAAADVALVGVVAAYLALPGWLGSRGPRFEELDGGRVPGSSSQPRVARDQRGAERLAQGRVGGVVGGEVVT